MTRVWQLNPKNQVASYDLERQGKEVRLSTMTENLTLWSSVSTQSQGAGEGLLPKIHMQLQQDWMGPRHLQVGRLPSEPVVLLLWGPHSQCLHTISPAAPRTGERPKRRHSMHTGALMSIPLKSMTSEHCSPSSPLCSLLTGLGPVCPKSTSLNIWGQKVTISVPWQ